ncbi:hypothetical protein GMRT_22691 [Giardia muris]|uniref:SET domain-containing protein n=1 Tax=Giardia muris TaxID=5742 RepID=A0A4Z1ST09_GIAMU|nr:hypothetical protein GMRT_22691 [Giardia muris]|eukprot:TNJ29024.1 hypothetical protein GMRT_22691 [Giardia muris]
MERSGRLSEYRQAVKAVENHEVRLQLDSLAPMMETDALMPLQELLQVLLTIAGSAFRGRRSVQAIVRALHVLYNASEAEVAGILLENVPSARNYLRPILEASRLSSPALSAPPNFEASSGSTDGMELGSDVPQGVSTASAPAIARTVAPIPSPSAGPKKRRQRPPLLVQEPDLKRDSSGGGSVSELTAPATQTVDLVSLLLPYACREDPLQEYRDLDQPTAQPEETGAVRVRSPSLSLALAQEAPKNEDDMRQNLAALLDTSRRRSPSSRGGRPTLVRREGIRGSSTGRKVEQARLVVQASVCVAEHRLPKHIACPVSSYAERILFGWSNVTAACAALLQNALQRDDSVVRGAQHLIQTGGIELLQRTGRSDHTLLAERILELASGVVTTAMRDEGSLRAAVTVHTLLARWMYLSHGAFTRLIRFQRRCVRQINLPNALPAVHNVDHDGKLILFSKFVAVQALIHFTRPRAGPPMYWNYALPMCLPHLTYDFCAGVDFYSTRAIRCGRGGCLLRAGEAIHLIPVIHPDLQCFAPVPRYLPPMELYTARQAPSLQDLRTSPDLVMRCNTESAIAYFAATEPIPEAICLFDVTGCYIPIELATHSLCARIGAALSQGLTPVALLALISEYIAHCLFVAPFFVVDMNECSSLVQHLIFADTDEDGNCEIGFASSFGQVVLRVYTTRPIQPGEPLLLPPKYLWAKPQSPLSVALELTVFQALLTAEAIPSELSTTFKEEGMNADMIYETLLKPSLQGIPEARPPDGDLSRLLPIPFLALLKHVLFAMLSISYKDLVMTEPTGFFSVGPVNAAHLYRGFQRTPAMRHTLLKNVGIANDIALDAFRSWETSPNLFTTLDISLPTDLDFQLPTIDYPEGRAPVATPIDTLLSAVENRAGASRRIGTEYNHYLLLYRLSYVLQALEDILANPFIPPCPFSTDTSPQLSFVDVGMVDALDATRLETGMTPLLVIPEAILQPPLQAQAQMQGHGQNQLQLPQKISIKVPDAGTFRSDHRQPHSSSASSTGSPVSSLQELGTGQPKAQTRARIRQPTDAVDSPDLYPRLSDYTFIPTLEQLDSEEAAGRAQAAREASKLLPARPQADSAWRLLDFLAM